MIQKYRYIIIFLSIFTYFYSISGNTVLAQKPKEVLEYENKLKKGKKKLIQKKENNVKTKNNSETGIEKNRKETNASEKKNLEKAEKKIRKHSLKIQTKKTRKRMKQTKRTAKRRNKGKNPIPWHTRMYYKIDKKIKEIKRK